MAKKKADTVTLDITNFYQIARELVATCCYDRDIDINKIEPLQWNGILLYIYDNSLGLDKTILKDVYPDCNVYDMDKVIQIYENYKRLCYEYSQIINIIGFTYVSGIGTDVINRWSDTSQYIIDNDINYIKGIESKYTSSDGVVINDSYKWDINYKRALFRIKSHNFTRMLKADNQASLESRMLDHSTNVMKVLPSLNRWHGWNLPHVSREEAPKKALTASELPDIPQLDTANQREIKSND